MKKQAIEVTIKTSEKILKSGKVTKKIEITQLNHSPGETPCKMKDFGCEGLAADGEWFCPACLRNIEKVIPSEESTE
ncbi:hypothetical protein [Desulfobacula sp.]|uniref:hypothetical protein n=1 Tax=Desulfobacula sp. TaxID=2593537 RepID=UPI002632AC0F|nr:hypothetical protein [Desulfobacula sp.]